VIEEEVEIVEMQHRDNRRKTPTEDRKTSYRSPAKQGALQ
jgi:hypothetical protein